MRPSGRYLVMDTLYHSYVDLEDPRYLELAYARSIRAAVDGRYPGRAPLASSPARCGACCDRAASTR